MTVSGVAWLIVLETPIKTIALTIRSLDPSLFAQLIVGFRLRLYPTYKN